MGFMTEPTSSFFKSKTNWRDRPNIRPAEQWLSAEDVNQVRAALFDLREVMLPAYGQINIDHDVGYSFMLGAPFHTYHLFAPVGQTGTNDSYGNVVLNTSSFVGGRATIGSMGAGMYITNTAASFAVDSVSSWEASVFINGTGSDSIVQRIDATTSGTTYNFGGSGLIRLVPGDYVDIRISLKDLLNSSQVIVDVESYIFNMFRVSV